MRIDPSKVGDAKVFRPWGWTVALIVLEEIKEALERVGATGTKFKDVKSAMLRDLMQIVCRADSVR
jgi:hypothetical protein